MFNLILVMPRANVTTPPTPSRGKLSPDRSASTGTLTSSCTGARTTASWVFPGYFPLVIRNTILCFNHARESSCVSFPGKKISSKPGLLHTYNTDKLGTRKTFRMAHLSSWISWTSSWAAGVPVGLPHLLQQPPSHPDPPT